MSNGAWLARLQQMAANAGGAATGLGRQVTYNAVTYNVIEKVVEKRDIVNLPEAIQTNVANADLRQWTFSAADFAAPASYPTEEGLVTVNEGGQAITFVVGKRRVENEYGADIAIHCVVYRQAPAPNATAEQTGEPNPGKRIADDPGFFGTGNPH